MMDRRAFLKAGSGVLAGLASGAGAFGLSKPAALNGPQFLAADVLKTPLRIEGGVAHVPTGPGLGIDVDEAKVVDLMKRSGGDRLLGLKSGYSIRNSLLL